MTTLFLKRYLISLSLIYFSGFAWTTPGRAQGTEESVTEFVATAYKDASKKEPLYTEHHRRVYNKDKISKSRTEFRDLAGKKFASLEVDYTRSLQVTLPEYVFEDSRFAIREAGVVLDPTSLSPRMQFSYAEGGTTKELKIDGDLSSYSASQGLAERITEKFSELERGAEVVTDYVVPAQGRSVGMTIQKVTITDVELVVEVKIRSGFVSFFASMMDGPLKLKMGFNRKTRRLLWIDGRSTLQNYQKKSQNVYLLYDSQALPEN